jgi:GDP-mannose transporter
MYYNNLITIPILLAASIFVEDWSPANIDKNFPIEHRNTLVIIMIFSGLSSVFISYSSAWCLRVTSSTTYSMVGALNKLPIALSGLIFFDAAVTLGSVSAIFFAFVSGIVYSLAKVRQNRKPAVSLPTHNVPVIGSSQPMPNNRKS